MADLSGLFGGGFDATQVEPRADYSAMPAGVYPVVLEKTEGKNTKSGQGWYVAFTFVIVDGKFKGRKLWDNVNFCNPNEDCVKMAHKTLGEMCRAMGVKKVERDTDELVGLTCLARVKVKEDRNEIAEYLSYDQWAAKQGEQAKAPAGPAMTPPQNETAPPAATAAPPTAPAAGFTPPWKK